MFLINRNPGKTRPPAERGALLRVVGGLFARSNAPRSVQFARFAEVSNLELISLYAATFHACDSIASKNSGKTRPEKSGCLLVVRNLDRAAADEFPDDCVAGDEVAG